MNRGIPFSLSYECSVLTSIKLTKFYSNNEIIWLIQRGLCTVFIRVTLSSVTQAKCPTGRRCRRPVWDVVACSALQECHRTECQTMVRAIWSLMEVHCGDMLQGNDYDVILEDQGICGLIISTSSVLGNNQLLFWESYETHIGMDIRDMVWGRLGSPSSG